MLQDSCIRKRYPLFIGKHIWTTVIFTKSLLFHFKALVDSMEETIIPKSYIFGLPRCNLINQFPVSNVT